MIEVSSIGFYISYGTPVSFVYDIVRSNPII